MDQERKGNQQQKKRSTTRTAVKLVLVVFFVLFVLAIVVLWVAPWFFTPSYIQAAIAEQTEQELGRPATVGDFKLKLIGGVNMVLNDLVVEDKQQYGDKPLLKVDKITLNADLIPLLRKKLVINSMHIENPQLSIVRSKDGRLNINDVPPRPKAPPQGKKPNAEAELQEIPYIKITDTVLQNGTVTFTNMQTNETTSLTDVQGKLDMEADPDKKTADINTATFSFDGFQFNAKGNIAGNQKNAAVKNLTVNSTADLTKLGQTLAPVLPVTIAGNATYNLTAQGPFSAVKTSSKAVLSNFKATGKMLQEPISIPLLTSTQSSILDLNKMSASNIDSRLESEALGLFAHMQGAIGDLVQVSGLDLKADARADIGKIAELAAAFANQPVTVQGKLDAQTAIAGDPAKKLTTNGKVLLNDLRVQSPDMQQPFTEKQVSLVYNVGVANQNSINVQQFDLNSSLVQANAQGQWSPEAADLTATADADLAAISNALVGIGAVPKDVKAAGNLNAKLTSATLKEGIETKLDAAITNFLLSMPQFAEPYKEDKITLTASSLVDFLKGRLNSVKRSNLDLNSKLATVTGSLTAKNLARAKPSMLADMKVQSQLEQLYQTLAALGFAGAENRVGGGMQMVLTLGTPDMVPAKAQAQQANAGAQPQNAPVKKNPPQPANYVARGTVTGSDIFINRVTIEKSATDFELQHRNFTARSTSSVGGGTLLLSEKSDFNKTPYAHEMQVTSQRILLTKELTDLFQRMIPIIPLPIGWLTGAVDAEANLASAGANAEAIFSDLDGQGKVRMPDNVRVVIPALSKIPGMQRYADMEFGTMKSDFTITNGLSKNTTIFSGSNLEMTLDGTTNLVVQKVPGVAEPGWPIDYRVSLKGEAVGRDLKRFLDKQGRLPIEIKGTLDSPKAKLMLSGLFGGLENLFK